METAQHTPARLSPRIWIALLLLGFAGQLAWGVENQYFNTFVYDNISPDPRPISWMVAASALTATLTTILMGALSDRVRSRWASESAAASEIAHEYLAHDRVLGALLADVAKHRGCTPDLLRKSIRGDLDWIAM